MVTIQKILLKHGLFSQDIRIKIKNEQIKLNGEVVTDSNMKLDIEFDEFDRDFSFQGLGDFLFNIIRKGGLGRRLLIASWEAGIEIDSLGKTGIENNLVEVFRLIYILRVSRREAIILIRKL